ncbi:Pepco domain-containing protein [Micromonospora chokoriensis]
MDAWVVDEHGKGLVDRQLKTITVNAEQVRAALEELQVLLPDDPDPTDGSRRRWRMDEVELTIELTAEGGVKLLGSATVGITGGIRVLFKRAE